MEQGLPLPRRIWAIVSVSAGSMLYTVDANIANVALPTISHALNVTPSAAVLLVSAYNLVLAMLLLPLAAIAERVGYRRVFLIGLICYLASAAGCFFSVGFTSLLAARAAQAVATASILSVSLAMVRTIYPANFLGRGLGLNTIAASGGAAIAPPLGGFIISLVSWKWVFVAGAPLAVLALIFSGSLPESERHSERYNFAGAILCALTFGLLIFGFQALSQKASLGLWVPSFIGGAIAAAIFIGHEKRAPRPVLPVDLLAVPSMALSVAAAFLIVVSSTTLLLYIPFRLRELGVGTAMIGAMIAPYAGTVMISAPMSGMMSDRVSPSVLGTIGLGIGFLGTLAFSRIPTTPDFTDIAWRIVLCGVGFGMFFSPNGRLIVGSVPRHRSPGASSLLATTRMFGQALGSAAIGGLLTLGLNDSALGLFAAGLVALGLVCSAMRIAIKKPAPS